MRTCLALITSLAAAGHAWANPLHSGTWVADPARIEFSDGSHPRNMSLTVTMEFTDTHLKYRSVNDTAKGRPPYVSEFAGPLDDTPVPFAGQERFNKVAIKRLSANEYRIMKLKDNDLISGEVWTFMGDGRSVVRRGVTKNPAGISSFYDEWFTRAK